MGDAGRTAKTDVMLVCSSGGHLLQLHALSSAWRDLSRLWVTFDKSDARSLLAAERLVFGRGPTNFATHRARSIQNLFANLVLAWRLVRTERPRVLVTTGAGIAVPFAWVARLHGARVIYVESLTRFQGPSLSCRLIAPVAHRLYVQWPELAEKVRHGVFCGSVASLP
jgi:UDP-N-acetylglucosamine:LPS N-acetylglucosamine transferase